jgi:hypothetical protein
MDLLGAQDLCARCREGNIVISFTGLVFDAISTPSSLRDRIGASSSALDVAQAVMLADASDRS